MSTENPYASPSAGGPPYAPPGRFQFGLHLERGFNAFTSQWQAWVLITLVVGLIGLAALIACVIPFFIVAGPLGVGMAAAALLALDGRPISIDTLKEAATDNFPNTLLGYLGVFGMNIGVQIVEAILGQLFRFAAGSGNTGQLIASILVLIVSLCSIAAQMYLGTKNMFVFTLLADRKCTVGEAFRISWNASIGRFWWLLLFQIVVGIIFGLGALACLVGLLATVPMGVCMIASAYRECCPRPTEPQLTL